MNISLLRMACKNFSIEGQRFEEREVPVVDHVDPEGGQRRTDVGRECYCQRVGGEPVNADRRRQYAQRCGHQQRNRQAAAQSLNQPKGEERWEVGSERDERASPSAFS